MRTETPVFIATESILWLRPDGVDIMIEAKIGAPYLVDESLQTWACPARLEGVDAPYPDIVGQGALQALSLAMRLVATRLGHLLEQHAQLVYPGAADDRIPWDWTSHSVLFGGLRFGQDNGLARADSALS